MFESAEARDVPYNAVGAVIISIKLVLVERTAAAGAQVVVLTAAVDLHHLVLEDVGLGVEALAPPHAAHRALAQPLRDASGRDACQLGLLFLRGRPSALRQVAQEIPGAVCGLDESAEPLLSLPQFLVLNEERAGE